MKPAQQVGRHPFIEAIASGEFRKARKQVGQRNARFQAGKGRANTKVDAVPEGMVMVFLTRQQELIGLRVHRGISVSRTHNHMNQLAGF